MRIDPPWRLRPDRPLLAGERGEELVVCRGPQVGELSDQLLEPTGLHRELTALGDREYQHRHGRPLHRPLGGTGHRIDANAGSLHVGAAPAPHQCAPLDAREFPQEPAEPLLPHGKEPLGAEVLIERPHELMGVSQCRQRFSGPGCGRAAATPKGDGVDYGVDVGAGDRRRHRDAGIVYRQRLKGDEEVEPLQVGGSRTTRSLDPLPVEHVGHLEARRKALDAGRPPRWPGRYPS